MNASLQRDVIRVHENKLVLPKIMKHQQQYKNGLESVNAARNLQATITNTVSKCAMLTNDRYCWTKF